MGRVVAGIEAIDKTRSRIFLETGESFVLYRGEIRQFKIQESEEIPEKVFQTIQEELLPQRAKKRCLNLLSVRPYTEYKLREKLRQGFYSEDIIEDALTYVKSFHYVDDYDYACQYIFFHRDTESKKKMEERLRVRGISKEILQQAFEDSCDSREEQQNMELVQAKKLLEKKHYDAKNMGWKEKQKIYAFLSRKGIENTVIRKAMDLQEWETC